MNKNWRLRFTTPWSWGSENAKGITPRAWNRTKIGDKFDIANSGMETDNDGRTRAGGVMAKHVKAIAQGKPGYIVAIDGEVDDEAPILKIITTKPYFISIANSERAGQNAG